jgi:hypothetical protein
VDAAVRRGTGLRLHPRPLPRRPDAPPTRTITERGLLWAAGLAHDAPTVR